jgi:predicted dehydrogenase
MKVVVVGFGFMGLSHTINILKNKKLKLVAIVDKNTGNIEKNLKEQSGNFSTGSIDKELLAGIKKFSDINACLADVEADAYFICVHTDLHYAMAKKLLIAGKHVFMEKPICLDILQGEELLSIAKEKNLILMIGQVVRFMPAYQKLKQWIASGEFGPLKFLSLSRFAGVPAWGEWMQKQASFGSTGGALFDLVMHDIDFVQSVLGRPDSVESMILPGKLSNYDYVSAFWKYKNTDFVVKIEGGNTFHSNFPFQASYAAEFEKASILYTTFLPDFITITSDTDLRRVEAGDANMGFSTEVGYFATCLEGNTQPLECTPESALQTIKICYDHIKSQ